MNKLNICSNIYKKEILKWIEYSNLNNKICTIENYKKFCCIELFNDIKYEEKLQNLLENIILIQNKIINKNISLKDKIKKTVFTPCRKESIENLKQYLKYHNYINLEGYITFRMGEYDHLINLILYVFIKNNINFDNLN